VHTTLLKTVQDLGGKCTTGDVIRKLNGLRDKRIYSAMEGFATNGFLEKTQPSGKSKNVWVMTKKGSEKVSSAIKDGTLLTLDEYTKKIKIYRKDNPKTPKNKATKSTQKNLLSVVKKQKKEPEPTMPNMSDAATAAVEGFAIVIDSEQKGRALIVQFHRMCEDYLNNQK